MLDALGFRPDNIKPEFKILGDSVDYLLKSERPLMFVEAKSLLDCLDKNLFDKHREQVLRYLQIKKLDGEIDDRVFELYGLTPDEIKIVEGTNR